MSLYPQEKIYRSVTYFVQTIVPSGVVVVDGQSYGIRFDDPTGQPTAVAVTITSTTDQPLELGSIGTSYKTVFTINATSRMQRDALKDIIRSGLAYHQIPVYSTFDEFTPGSGAVIEKYCALGDYFQARDTLNLNSGREKFFWGAVVFASLDVLGL